MSELVESSAVELRRLIGARQLSPVELLEACIARIERLNPFVNAITATCYERARAEARAAEQAVMRGEPLGLLHGLPVTCIFGTDEDDSLCRDKVMDGARRVAIADGHLMLFSYAPLAAAVDTAVLHPPGPMH